MRPLVIVEALAVAAFVGLAALAVLTPEPEVSHIDAAALAAGPTDERWQGIFVGDKHVGYSVTREAVTADGGRVFAEQSVFRIAAMGAAQEVVTAGNAVTDAQGHLRTFDFLLSGPTRLSGRGEVRGDSVHVEIDAGGESRAIDVPITEPPTLSVALPAQLRGRTLTPGERFTIPIFDPILMASSQREVVVESTEVLPNGEVGTWLRLAVAGSEVRRLVDASGETVREEGALGLRTERMTREAAMQVDDGDAPDLVSISAVPVAEGFTDSRSLVHVSLRVSGIEPERIPDEPPLQDREGDQVTVSVPLWAELPSVPLIAPGSTEETSPSPTLPSTHPEIIAKAREVVGDAPDRKEAAKRLTDFVFSYVAKVPAIGVPDGLTVLRTARGDCNEHTALYVSLARAVGLPARIAAGLVYSDRLGEAFYYHAWPEVDLGGGWVPVDPTFGEHVADATHLKLVTGDLAQQVQIMGIMGRIRLERIEAR
jgi:hypothetical protein